MANYRDSSFRADAVFSTSLRAGLGLEFFWFPWISARRCFEAFSLSWMVEFFPWMSVISSFDASRLASATGLSTLRLQSFFPLPFLVVLQVTYKYKVRCFWDTSLQWTLKNTLKFSNVLSPTLLPFSDSSAHLTPLVGGPQCRKIDSFWDWFNLGVNLFGLWGGLGGATLGAATVGRLGAWLAFFRFCCWRAVSRGPILGWPPQDARFLKNSIKKW